MEDAGLLSTTATKFRPTLGARNSSCSKGLKADLPPSHESEIFAGFRCISEREGVDPDEDGSITIEHPLADAEWGRRHVLQYGPDAEVLEPAELRDEITSRLKAITTA